MINAPVDADVEIANATVNVSQLQATTLIGEDTRQTRFVTFGLDIIVFE